MRSVDEITAALRQSDAAVIDSALIDAAERMQAWVVAGTNTEYWNPQVVALRNELVDLVEADPVAPRASRAVFILGNLFDSALQPLFCRLVARYVQDHASAESLYQTIIALDHLDALPVTADSLSPDLSSDPAERAAVRELALRYLQQWPSARPRDALSLPLRYYRARWAHDRPDLPVEIHTEVDAEGWEIRKVHRFSAGSTDYADATRQTRWCGLGELPRSVEHTGTDELVEDAISASDFDAAWQRAVASGGLPVADRHMAVRHYYTRFGLDQPLAEAYTEVDRNRRETRKVHVFRDGRTAHADASAPARSIALSTAPMPDPPEVGDTSYTVEIPAAEFDEVWQRALASGGPDA